MARRVLVLCENWFEAIQGDGVFAFFDIYGKELWVLGDNKMAPLDEEAKNHSEVIIFFKKNGLSDEKKNSITMKLRELCEETEIITLDAEICYYVEVQGRMCEDDQRKLRWLLAPPFHNDFLSDETNFTLSSEDRKFMIIEIGPRLNFSSPFSTNAVSICHSCGLQNVSRLEFSTKYLLIFDTVLNEIQYLKLKERFCAALHDRMTECEYTEKIVSFHIKEGSANWYNVEILKNGRKALEDVSKNMGLAFDDWDLDYYTNMFKNTLKRNPTNVECFDLAQSNSEHSRHWFFKGKLIIDNKVIPNSLMQMVMETQKFSNNNSVIKFSDNSSAIQGFDVNILKPLTSDAPNKLHVVENTRHIIFTAETHNFPTGVSPFSGATTGTGGRIRDVHAAGRGSHVVAGTAGYCFGNLHIPGYSLPWENSLWSYPNNFAPPLNIAIEASNGASDYGNKFGEPIISGFARSFGMELVNGERREWIKPIMFTGGIGQIDSDKTEKMYPDTTMEVVKIGGPVYRIGVGGGAASSIHVQGSSQAQLDFDAVQRGDAEMAQKLNRVVRACIENAENPICSIHDQGAGGNGNVLKEICEPSGACIYSNRFQLGDPTINILELWGAEYQESDAILVQDINLLLLKKMAKREKCPISCVGHVTDSKKIILKESSDLETDDHEKKNPVELDLSNCLPSGVQKEFVSNRMSVDLKPLKFPEDMLLIHSLERVLRLPAVASKRYLTNKVDRSVTGLIAQQQCVGPLHTPLADVAVVAISYFDKVGSATAIGEQPIKGLIDPAAGARLSVAESLSNIVFAKLTSRKDIKCSSNWMWPAKLPGECANIYDACKAMCDVMSHLGIAVDGGKDSLSMAARVENDVIKSPGALVVSAYAPCIDIEATITPDLKCPDGKGILLHIMASSEIKHRLGGSALAQVYSQLGEEVPDVDYPDLLSTAFDTIQSFILGDDKSLITAGHDISDGGLISCLLEMAFAGNCGINVGIKSDGNSFSVLFAEEVGWVLEVRNENVKAVVNAFVEHGIVCNEIGFSLQSDNINIFMNDENILCQPMSRLRDIWEETSFELDKLQATPSCVFEERDERLTQKNPIYQISFKVSEIFQSVTSDSRSIKVAVLREEGINGDREMAAALFMAGFEVWDVTMQDLFEDSVDLDIFSGLIFPGGFSYADVLGSAKGWAAGIIFNSKLKEKFDHFCSRKDTFTFGVCNGCQFMAQLGLIAPASQSEDLNQGVVLGSNTSGRFESRFSTVKITKSPSIMFTGMEDSTLGIWVAHAEGKFQFKNKEILKEMKKNELIPLSYVDNDGNATTKYPFNPNGSVDGIAAICSEDGRHLAMMPHPERCVLKWQWPYLTETLKEQKVSPWMQLFSNAYKWCSQLVV
ncbi:Phosphoribosylformylglycinamidine synthase [Nymphon striatum]|nr:Phosphoribosylformylglycinamidine synthase [Nymphon striatum]